MPKVSLSGMTVEALMDLRERVDEMLHRRRAELEKQLERTDRAIALVGGRRIWSRGWKRIERKEGPAEISRSVRRDLGGSWRKTSMACCCDQRWKETRRFPDRQVSTKGTEKAQVKTLSFA